MSGAQAKAVTGDWTSDRRPSAGGYETVGGGGGGAVESRWNGIDGRPEGGRGTPATRSLNASLWSLCVWGGGGGVTIRVQYGAESGAGGLPLRGPGGPLRGRAHLVVARAMPRARLPLCDGAQQATLRPRTPRRAEQHVAIGARDLAREAAPARPAQAVAVRAAPPGARGPVDAGGARRQAAGAGPAGGAPVAAGPRPVPRDIACVAQALRARRVACPVAVTRRDRRPGARAGARGAPVPVDARTRGNGGGGLVVAGAARAADGAGVARARGVARGAHESVRALGACGTAPLPPRRRAAVARERPVRSVIAAPHAVAQEVPGERARPRARGPAVPGVAHALPGAREAAVAHAVARADQPAGCGAGLPAPGPRMAGAALRAVGAIPVPGRCGASAVAGSGALPVHVAHAVPAADGDDGAIVTEDGARAVAIAVLQRVQAGTLGGGGGGTRPSGGARGCPTAQRRSQPPDVCKHAPGPSPGVPRFVTH